MIRDDRYKLVVARSGQALKLYDLASDPAETVNLVGREGTDPAIGALRDRLLRWHLETATDNALLCRPAQ
jgi:arylsulfatase A-like enzyme